ncbi:MAG TPA: signal peptidase I [Roseiarcus sp.]|nr:signal peptidase I [Roseiarcus sp.]
MTEPMRLKGEGVDASVKKSEEGGLWEIVKVILQAVAIAIVIRTLLFQPFNIPSGSLIPTLDIGDYLFVSKYSYGYSHFSLPSFLDWFSNEWHGRILASQPKRGDVIVFRLPRDETTDYIKRLIGLPGDKIQMVHGRLVINGQMVERQPLPPYHITDRSGHDIAVPHYLETLPGGVKHEIIQIEGDDGFYSNTDVYTVPPGHYFMMGDNRDNSTDSRVPEDRDGVGYVPFENLIGKAQIIFFSVKDGYPAWEFWEWPWTVRWNRLFQPVH